MLNAKLLISDWTFVSLEMAAPMCPTVKYEYCYNRLKNRYVVFVGNKKINNYIVATYKQIVS